MFIGCDGVRAHGVAAVHHLFDHAGIGLRHPADIEECRLGAELVERVEDAVGELGQRAVVKCQHDFLRTQEARLLLVLGEATEQRAGGWVDFDDAFNAERAFRGGAGLFGFRPDGAEGGGCDADGDGQGKSADHRLFLGWFRTLKSHLHCVGDKSQGCARTSCQGEAQFPRHAEHRMDWTQQAVCIEQAEC
ncbi:hypothetical protein [Hyphomicrobium sp. D-2]|uniref:hypothetical protein n=1 Tax=Hyphomicrobium sp. D-2 TaxID=3041621 RepID=UPI0024572C7E|nr:hypothetical protein [Hyphomicrobium sp. D-2]MDH4982802.1 hypothetical protein [Hyphomicrobium sp. D-2]